MISIKYINIFVSFEMSVSSLQNKREGEMTSMVYQMPKVVNSKAKIGGDLVVILGWASLSKYQIVSPTTPWRANWQENGGDRFATCLSSTKEGKMAACVCSLYSSQLTDSLWYISEVDIYGRIRIMNPEFKY